MAEMQMPHRAATGRKSTLSKATNMMGAAISLALLVGVTVWGYKLLMRDVSGVPVVRAAEGPMRVQPENRGGEQAQHQGLSVNDVAAVGTAAGPADQVVLAPAPLDLADEDAVVGNATAEETVPAQPEITPELAAAVTREPQTAEEETLQLAAVEQLAARLAEGVDPLQALDPVIEPDPEAGAEGKVIPEAEDLAALDAPDAAPKPEIKGGLKRSLRPHVRPASLNTTNRETTAEAVAASLAGTGAVQDVAPESIPVGTRLAQLGAFDSAEVARAEWDRLNGRFGEYLEGKARVIQKAQSGGRTFYRLRAMGFEDLSDARRFCSALVSEKAECIPVVTR